jgi:hypothetical protein
VVPSFRSGVLVRFAPQKSTGATLILRTGDGELVPPGAEVKIGDTVAGQVAYHGEVFLPSLTAPARLLVEWPRHTCELVVAEFPTRCSHGWDRFSARRRNDSILERDHRNGSAVRDRKCCNLHRLLDWRVVWRLQRSQFHQRRYCRPCHSDLLGTQSERVSYSLSLTRTAAQTKSQTLQGPGHALRYGLFLNAARTERWGDGNPGAPDIKDSMTLVNGHGSQDYVIYGRMPSKQSDASDGIYMDTLVMTLVW